MKKTLATALAVLSFFQVSVASAGYMYAPGDYKASSNLNVRYQPKVGDNRIDHFLKGDTVKVTKVLGSWCKVDYKKYRSAYVRCAYLTNAKKVVQVEKPLSAEAKLFKDYNDAVVSIRKEALQSVADMIFSSQNGVDSNDYMIQHGAEIFTKVGVIFDKARKDTAALSTPPALANLAKAVDHVYEVDAQIVSKLVAYFSDTTNVTKSYEDMATQLSDVIGTERVALSLYEDQWNIFVKQYGLEDSKISRIDQ